MKWTTNISHIDGDDEVIRGYQLEDLVREKGFIESIYLILKGELPGGEEKDVLDAILTSAIDHGTGTASAMTARITASAGNDMHTALAAGLLAMGKKHGGAVSGAARFFQANISTDDLSVLLSEMKERRERVPGYGHAVLEHDKRSDLLLEIAKSNNIYGQHCELAERIYEELNKISSKKLPLNIDGAIGAILSDMGFSPEQADALFIIARVPGLAAHVSEEMESGPGLRRLQKDETEYTGETGKQIS